MTANNAMPVKRAAPLHCQRIVPPDGAKSKPWLVLLHGLLGSADDWRELCPHLQAWPVLLVDLPGHGKSVATTVRDFDEMNHQLTLALHAHGVERYWLVGYSLGGRIAMHYATWSLRQSGLCGLLIEGGNPGLTDEAQREARCEHDAHWAQRLRSEPLPEVLDAWYRQAVFADLNDAARRRLVALRSGNDSAGVAAMLEATSLGRQPWLLGAVRNTGLPFGYLCGAQDAKFQAIARANNLPLLPVPLAGHNAHRANPAVYAQHISAFITRHDAGAAHA